MSEADVKTDVIEFGKWELERILGSGSFGKVMLFKHKESGEKVAIKKCHSHANTPIIKPERWSKEVQIVQDLKHPGLVSTLPVPEPLKILEQEAPILCMEYCSGGDLRQMLNKPANCCGLSEKDVLNILNDIGDAILYLHSVKVVHRDIKPENIVIQLTGKTKLYKLIDLGYAKDLNHQSLCKSLVGTLQYLAPELFSSNQYNCTVDYWSFGIVIHECITGVRPFLPGCAPPKWMQEVETKSREDICVYTRPDGHIVFTQKLFKENHLNSVLQNQMVEWLQLMLDWDPNLRGRNYIDPSQPGPLIALENLKPILHNEVVSIFWPDGLRHLCYIVTDDITMETLKGWIHRDTNINPQDQLILLPRGHCPDDDKSAKQLLSLDDSQTVYLFNKSSENGTCEKIPFPEFVEIMLTNPRLEVEYYVQKRMWAQSAYFINQQTIVHRKLLGALKVYLTHVTLESSVLKQQMTFILTALSHVNAGHQLFTHSLQLDQHNYQLQAKRGGLPSCTMLQRWAEAELILSTHLSELQKKGADLELLLNGLLTAVHDIGKRLGAFLCKPDERLDACSQQAFELYGSIQRRSKDQKLQLNNNIAMTKIIVSTLKIQKGLFNECFTGLRCVEKCSADVDRLLMEMNQLKNGVDKFQNQMLYMQNERQKDIWTLLERAVTFWQRTSMLNQNQSCVPSLNHVSLPSLVEADQALRESLTAIKENQNLRYQIQDALSKGLIQTRMKLQNNFDWSFLEH